MDLLDSQAEVHWEFRNGHKWSKSFDSTAERDHWVNIVGLVTHPDIVRVEIREGDFEFVLKDAAEKQQKP